MVELETINMLIQMVGVSSAAIATVIGVRSYILSNRRAEEARARELETRQAQLFMQVYSKWQDKEYNESKQLVLHEYRCENVEDYEGIVGDREKASNLRSIGTFLEGLGVLVKRGLVDVGFVDDMMSGDVIGFWEKYGGAVKEFRVRMGYPQALEWAEYLFDEVKSVAVSQHPELKSSSQ